MQFVSAGEDMGQQQSQGRDGGRIQGKSTLEMAAEASVVNP